MARSGVTTFLWWMVLVGLAGFLLIPLVVLLGTSVTTTGFLAFPPRGFTLNWYQKVLGDSSYLDAFRLSFEVAFTSSLIALCAGVPASVAILRGRFPGRHWLQTLFTLPMMVPQIVLGVALLQFLTAMGIARTWWGLTLSHSLLALPYVIRTVGATLVGFNRSLEEAAEDLGARPLQTFLLITLPLIKGGVVAAGLFGFAMSWINVEISMFLANSQLLPLPVKLMNYVQYSVDPTVAAVSAATVVLAFFILFLLDRLVGLERVGS